MQKRCSACFFCGNLKELRFEEGDVSSLDDRALKRAGLTPECLSF